MARLLICHDRVQTAERRSQVECVQHFGNVAYPLRETAGTVRPDFVVCKEGAVLFKRAAASGCIDDVDVGAAAFERLDVALGELARKVDLAGMERDRSAAALGARNGDR